MESVQDIEPTRPSQDRAAYRARTWVTRAGIKVDQHMTGEQPRVMFLHYWGIGSTRDLARGLRAALDHTAVRVGAR